MVEGKLRSRVVVLEFPSFEAALACYRSPEFAAAKKLREPASVADIVVLEGYAGTQPYEQLVLFAIYHAIPTLTFRSLSHGRNEARGRRGRRADGPHAG